MKIISIITAVVAALLLLSTLICGLWIRSNRITDLSSLDFHMKIGIASLILCFIALTWCVFSTYLFDNRKVFNRKQS